MTGFALYRLPHEKQVTLVAQNEGEPLKLPSINELNGRSGFVLAPFSVTSEEPLLLIKPDVVKSFSDVTEAKDVICNSQMPYLQMVNAILTGRKWHTYEERSAYAEDFARFHARLKDESFQKIVLSRCSVTPRDGEDHPLELFCKACQLYPRMFISLVCTEQSGCWLTATPEILLEGVGNQWRTIALAGTMKLKDEDLNGEGEHATWSTKNIQEQRYVATYLMNCLERVADDIHEEGPRTVRAANLVHLRSDFTFTLSDNECVGDVLQLLHPTPAVCGLPKQDAYDFILSNEHTPRLYYSGFMGPLNLRHQPSDISPQTSDLSPQTHLYVSLRCMQVTDTQYRLYAGGGLLKDSVEEQEWMETEAKMETMRRVLKTQ